MDNIVARLMAHRLGREPTQEEIDEHNRIQNEAIDLSSGVMGTVGKIPQFGKIRNILSGTKEVAPEAAEQAMPFIDKYRQAVANTSVRQPVGNEVKSTLKGISFKPDAEQSIGKVIQEAPQVADEAAPIMSEANRLKLLQMIRQDKKLLGK